MQECNGISSDPVSITDVEHVVCEEVGLLLSFVARAFHGKLWVKKVQADVTSLRHGKSTFTSRAGIRLAST